MGTVTDPGELRLLRDSRTAEQLVDQLVHDVVEHGLRIDTDRVDQLLFHPARPRLQTVDGRRR